MCKNERFKGSEGVVVKDSVVLQLLSVILFNCVVPGWSGFTQGQSPCICYKVWESWKTMSCQGYQVLLWTANSAIQQEQNNRILVSCNLVFVSFFLGLPTHKVKYIVFWSIHASLQSRTFISDFHIVKSKWSKLFIVKWTNTPWPQGTAKFHLQTCVLWQRHQSRIMYPRA